MTKNNATARPWQAGAYGLIYGQGDLPTIDGRLSHNEAVPICEVKNGAFGTQSGFAKNEIAKANRDYIVRAVNSHEELLEVARFYLKHITGKINNVKPINKLEKFVKEAIAKAEA